MGLPVGELQTAIIALYRGDTTLQGLLTGSVTPTWNIYDADGVPINTAFPYVVVQEVMGKLGTVFAMQSDASDVITLVSVFTQSGGFLQARAIAKQIDALTQKTSLTLTGGFTNIGTLRDNYAEIPAQDGITQQVSMRFRAWVSG